MMIELPQRRVFVEQGLRQLAEHLAQTLIELRDHDRIDPVALERLLHVELRRIHLADVGEQSRQLPQRPFLQDRILRPGRVLAGRSRRFDSTLGLRLGPLRDHHHLRPAARVSLIERLHPAFAGQRLQTLSAHPGLRRGVDLHPAIDPQRPIDRNAAAVAQPFLHPARAAAHVFVQKCVRGRVVALTHVPEHPRARGENDEEVQFQSRRGFVEVHHACDFPGEHRPQFLFSLLQEKAVADQTRTVNHTCEIAVLFADIAHRSLYRFAITHIQAQVPYLRTLLAQLLQLPLLRFA